MVAVRSEKTLSLSLSVAVVTVAGHWVECWELRVWIGPVENIPECSRGVLVIFLKYRDQNYFLLFNQKHITAASLHFFLISLKYYFFTFTLIKSMKK